MLRRLRMEWLRELTMLSAHKKGHEKMRISEVRSCHVSRFDGVLLMGVVLCVGWSVLCGMGMKSQPMDREHLEQLAEPFPGIGLRDVPIQTREKGIRFEETDRYEDAIRQVMSVSVESLAAGATEFQMQRRGVWANSERAVQKFQVFSDLYFHPQAYQGKPLTLTGHLQRVVKLPPEEGSDLPVLYEAWLFPEDGQQNAVVVICRQIPPGVGLGDVTVDHVQVSGIFYRHYTYEGGDELRYAPMVLSPRIELYQNPDAVLTRDEQVKLLVAGISLLLMGGIVAYVVSSKKRPARGLFRKETLADRIDLSEIDRGPSTEET